MSFFDDFEIMLMKLALEMQVKKVEHDLKETLEKQGIIVETNFEINVKSVDLDTWHKVKKELENSPHENADDDSENELYNIIKTYKE